MANAKSSSKPKKTQKKTSQKASQNTSKRVLNEKGYMVKLTVVSVIFILILLGILYGNEILVNISSFIFGKYPIPLLVLLGIASAEYCYRRTKNAKCKEKEFQWVMLIAVLLLSGLLYGWNKDYSDAVGLELFTNWFKTGSFAGFFEYIINRGLVNVVVYSLFTEVIGHSFAMTLFIAGLALLTLYLVGTKRLSAFAAKVSDHFKELMYSDDSDEHDEAEEQNSTPQKGNIGNYFTNPIPVKKDKFISADGTKKEESKPAEIKVAKPEPKVNQQQLRFEEIDEIETKTFEEDIKPIEPKPAMEGAVVVESVNTGKKYKLPDLKLLDRVVVSDNEASNYDYAEQKGEELIQVLADFKVEAELVCFHVGPAVTKFEIRPTAKIKVSKVLELQDNIKMELAVKDIRIEAPIPGKNTIGVEIPNKHISVVRLKELLTKERMKGSGQPKLSVVLGKNLLGETVYCDLSKMPHLLVAGATGSGKSVCMNSIIMSILYRANPDEVKLVLIDPKQVEFSNFAELPHLISPVITDSAEAARALKVVVGIMDERYNRFSKAGAKNIRAYNDKVEKGMLDQSHKVMPYIVVIIDELADLMLVAGKDVEASIQRITQLARAAGIHLIVATQRPSTDVITGIIKANIPSRIAFAVSNGIDSKVILDRPGAEKLLGYGDMLYAPIGSNVMSRAQGVYVTDEEIERVISFVTEQKKPMFHDAFINAQFDEKEENGTYNGKSAKDPMYAEVKQYVIETKKASTSLLQRRFGIGYNRAARLIDMLEANGVIGPANGSKPRDVYV